jgi:hypothetical protein
MERVIHVAPAQEHGAGRRCLVRQHSGQLGDETYRCLRHEPLRTLDQRIAGCLAFTSQRGLRHLPLKGLLERLHVRSAGRLSLSRRVDIGWQSRERVAARRPKFLCSRAMAFMPRGIIPNLDAPGISPPCSTQSPMLALHGRSVLGLVEPSYVRWVT